MGGNDYDSGVAGRLYLRAWAWGRRSAVVEWLVEFVGRVWFRADAEGGRVGAWMERLGRAAWGVMPGVFLVAVLLSFEEVRRWYGFPLDWFFAVGQPYLQVFYPPPPTANSIVDGPIPQATVIIHEIWFIVIPLIMGGYVGSRMLGGLAGTPVWEMAGGAGFALAAVLVHSVSRWMLLPMSWLERMVWGGQWTFYPPAVSTYGQGPPVWWAAVRLVWVVSAAFVLGACLGGFVGRPVRRRGWGGNLLS